MTPSKSSCMNFQPGQPIRSQDIKSILTYFIQHAETLKQAHDVKGVYGVITPQDFVIENDELKLHSSHFYEVYELEQLRWIAPEMLSRHQPPMVCSDLYSLGAIFYFYLVGKPPFTGDTPLEVAHQHMALQVIPASKSCPEVPQTISNILDKLLSKQPQARYASVEGLLRDLYECLRQHQSLGYIEPFELGISDRRGQFLIPDKLYGRENEVAILDHTFDRALSGEIVLCMVGGYSGIGKSALVRAMKAHIEDCGGCLVEGKFDQYHRETPYSALIEAFRSLLRQLLSRSRTEIDLWSEQVKKVLGENAMVIIAVLPELERLIGTHPPAPELTGEAARQRFNILFSELLKLFASEQHPLVMFLDDLQWSDFASLDLVKSFVRRGAGAHLLLVGAYRDNEVGPAHPMTQMLEDLRQEKALIYELQVGPLKKQHVAEMIQDTFYGFQKVQDISDIVMRKAEGNPFFTRQFLTSLVRQNDFYFDAIKQRWCCDLQSIRLRDVSENVVELMTRRISLLPHEVQILLKVAACIGKQFDLELLSMVMREDEDTVLKDLSLAVNDEFIIPIHELSEDKSFQFAHDRVQQASYMLMVGDSHKSLHLQIGMSLWSRCVDDVEPEVFAIVDQLDQAIELLSCESECIEVARLNLIAGRRARSSMAYRAAAKYLQIARDLLPEGHWSSHYRLSYEIYLDLVEVYSVLNLEAEFNLTVNDLMKRVDSDHDRLKVRIRQTAHLCLSSRLFEGLEIGCIGLSEIGIQVPKQHNQAALMLEFERNLALFRQKTQGLELSEHLFNLPNAKDPLSEDIMRLIGAMADAATITNTPLLSLLAATGGLRSLEYGNTSLSPLLYSLLGQGVIAHERAYLEGRDLAQVAIRLMSEKRLDLWSYGRSRVHQFWFILHWSRHIEKSLPEVEEALAVTRRAHDPLYAAYLLNIIVITQYFTGRSTVDVIAAHERVCEHCKPYSMDVIIGFTQCYAGAAAALRGETAGLTIIDSEHVREADFKSTFKEMPMVMGLYCGARIPLFGLAGQWNAVLDIADDSNLRHSPPFLPHTVIQFWRGVASAALARNATGKERDTYLDHLNQAQAFLNYIANHASSENVLHRIAFLDAEIARLEGDKRIVTARYQRAENLAEAQGFLLESAFFAETLAAWQADSWFDDQDVYDSLQRAIKKYARVQAFVLERRVQTALKARKKRSSGEQLPALDSSDTQALLSAVQAITGFSDLNALLIHLIKIIIDSSGAERGCVLEQKNEEISVVLSQEYGCQQDRYPLSIVRYVMNTGETVVLDNGVHQGDGSESWDNHQDAYLQSSMPASLLCQAIDRHRPVRRVLYLEHQVLRGVFSPKRRRMLDWLIGQAAISIENAELYSDLESKVAERTRKLSEANEILNIQQQELLVAKEEALKAADAKAAFLANMSHEIRTPMNAILGMTQLALKTEINPKTRNYLTKVNDAAESLLVLLNDILEYSRFEAGKVKLERVEFDLELMIEHLRTICLTWLGKKPVELHFDLDAEVPRFLIGDPHRLSQVLINLTSNALKFTEKGDVVFKARVLDVKVDQTELKFTIADTGIGIPDSRLSALFEIFEQVDSSTTRKYGGSGLGLAISKRLVEAWGGKIWVESELNKGSRFHVTGRFGLPKENALTKSMPMQSQFQRLHVLVADDNPIALEIIAQTCSRFGFTTQKAQTLSAAEDFYGQAIKEKQPFDLMILDGGMTPDNGVMFIKQIRNQWPVQQCYFLVTVTELIESFLDDFASMESVERLMKPITASSLFEALGSAFSKRLPYDKSDLALNESSYSEMKHLLKDVRVMLVEDNEMNLELAIDLLEGAGAKVHAVRNGVEALQALSTSPNYDVVLMDCQMPIMDGYEATRRIKHELGLLNLPIIAMTANVMPDDRDKALNVGMCDYISKPIHPNTMFETLVRWIAKTKAEVSSTQSIPTQAKTTELIVLAECQLTGVDVSKGLAFCNDQELLYIKQLYAFKKHFGSFQDKLEQLTSQGDVKGLQRLFHSLKGAAGTLGADGIALLASEIEISLGEQESIDKRHLNKLLDQVETLLEEIQYLPDIDELSCESQQDRKQQIEALSEAISHFDTLAKVLALEFNNTLSVDEKAYFQPVISALERYDFETAQKVFEHFCNGFFHR